MLSAISGSIDINHLLIHIAIILYTGWMGTTLTCLTNWATVDASCRRLTYFAVTPCRRLQCTAIASLSIALGILLNMRGSHQGS